MARVNRFAVRMINAIKGDEGQSMAEYGLILAGVAVVVMGAVVILGTTLEGTFADVVDAFTP